MFRLLHPPTFDGSQCRDLQSGLALARYDVEDLLSTAHRIASVLADSERQLSALVERVEQQANLHVDGGVAVQYSGRHLVELLYQVKRVELQKKDSRYVWLLESLITDSGLGGLPHGSVDMH